MKKGTDMKEKYERQMKKGVLDMLVLKLLETEPKHGYRIIQEMKEKSEEVFSLKDGTLYPVLYRLEDDGLVISRKIHGKFRGNIMRLRRREERRLSRCGRFGNGFWTEPNGLWKNRITVGQNGREKNDGEAVCQCRYREADVRQEPEKRVPKTAFGRY